MSEETGLPDGWTVCILGDVILDTISTAGPRAGNEFIYIDISSVDNQEKRIKDARRIPVAEAPSRARQRLQANDILVSMTRPNLNAVALVPAELGDAIGSTGFCVLRPQIEPAFIFYRVQSILFIDEMTRLVQGALYPAIRPRDIFAHRLPLPPLAEQGRIVAKIEEHFTRLDAGVAALKRVRANLKRYRASVLKAAVEGKLTEEWRAAHPATESGGDLLQRILQERRTAWEQGELERYGKAGKTPPKGWRDKYRDPVVSDLPSLPVLPDGWAWATVGQILREPPCNGISVKGSDSPPGVPALRLSAMSSSGFNYADRRFIPIETSTASVLAIKTGDFFVSRGNGSLHLVGRGTLAQDPPECIVFPDTMIRLRLWNCTVFHRYINNIWLSRLIRRQIENRARTTAGIYKISQADIGLFSVPIAPLAEQSEIVAEVERRLSVASAAEAQVEAALIRAERLRQSILKRAFEGRLVEQDASDEPASALLARLRAGREDGEERARVGRGPRRRV